MKLIRRIKDIAKNDVWKVRKLPFLIMLILFSLIICGDYFIYRYYKNSIVNEEKKQLLTMAQIVGNNLRISIEAETDKIRLYYGKPVFDDETVVTKTENFLEWERELYSCAQIVDENDRILMNRTEALQIEYRLPDDAKPQEAIILGKSLKDSGGYALVVGIRVAGEVKTYDVLLFMDLNTLYKKIVEPVKIGHGGYSVVKDENLDILMHHAKNQIGIDAIVDREKLYPHLDLKSLRNWLNRQVTEEEGFDIVDSYVWDSEDLLPVTRIVSFTKIRFQNETWIVNSTIPIEEISAPVTAMSIAIGVLTLLFFLLLLCAFYIVIKAIIKEEANKKEIGYLKQLNYGMEMIAKQNDEIRHYQRIQSLGMMASHIAHEFNNYLTPVMIYSEILEADEEISAENKTMLWEITKAIERAAKLSKDLLAFSRQDAGEKMKALDIVAETSDAVSVVRQLTPKEITLHTHLPKDAIYVFGRDGMLQHILMNLCKNAFQAMENSEKKELGIALKQVGDEVVLSVKDTGCGISSDSMLRIFEPFYTTKGSKHGTGLGLSVIQNVMNSVNGRIEVKSRSGEGAEFILHFPVHKEEEMSNRITGVRRIAVVGEHLGVHGKQIQSMGLGAKYKFFFHNHPAEVISDLSEDPKMYDLVISDYGLETMNGVEFLGIVKRIHDKTRRILVVESMGKDLEWYRNNGIVDRILSIHDFEKEMMLILESQQKETGQSTHDTD